MTFGAPDWGCDEKEAHCDREAVFSMAGAGIPSTPAERLRRGKSEEISSFLPQVPREQIVLASSATSRWGTKLITTGLSRKTRDRLL